MTPSQAPDLERPYFNATYNAEPNAAFSSTFTYLFDTPASLAGAHDPNLAQGHHAAMTQAASSLSWLSTPSNEQQQHLVGSIPLAPSLAINSLPVTMAMPQDLSWLQSCGGSALSQEGDTNSALGLFFPAQSLTGEAPAWSTSHSLPLPRLAPATTERFVPRTFASDFIHHPSHARVFAQPEVHAMIASATDVSTRLDLTQKSAYRHSLTSAHTDRPGRILCLHPPSQPVSTTPVIESSSSQSHPPVSHSNQRSEAIANPRQRHIEKGSTAILPRQFSDVIMIVDDEDTVLCTSSSVRICTEFVFGSTTTSGPKEANEGWSSLTLNHQTVKFSDLLADEQAICCWQQACRSIRTELAGSHTSIPQVSEATRRIRPMGRRELVLKRRSRGGGEPFVKVHIVAITDSGDQCSGRLLIQMRPVELPSVAEVSSRSLSTQNSQPHPISQQVIRRGDLDQADFRLLVSRSGIILRTGFSTLAPTCVSQDLQAQAMSTLFGDAARAPEFGQNLVDVPRLALLLHVVAQAAVVGLARTVKIDVGGSKVLATMQPVLRGGSPADVDRGGVRLPAAKVWITLSLFGDLKHRSSTNLSRRMEAIPKVPIQDHTIYNRGSLLSRRHSEQVLNQGRGPHTFAFAQSTPAQVDRRASVASLHPEGRSEAYRTILTRSSDSGRNVSPPPPKDSKIRRTEDPARLQDSLSPILSKLREENRLLRERVNTRRLTQYIQMQQRRQSSM